MGTCYGQDIEKADRQLSQEEALDEVFSEESRFEARAHKPYIPQNPSGNPQKILKQKWDRWSWVDWVKFEYRYQNGKVVFQENKINKEGNWENLSRYYLKYDEAGRLTEQLYQTWRENKWQNFYRYVFQYDGQGNLVYKLYENHPGKWQGSFRFYYSYKNGIWTKEYSQRFSKYQGWVNNRTIFYSYREDKVIESYQEGWNGSSWAPLSKRDIQYDAKFEHRTKELIYVPVGTLAEEYSYFLNSSKSVHTIRKLYNGSLHNSKRSTSLLSQGKSHDFLQEVWRYGSWQKSYRWDIEHKGDKLKRMTKQTWKDYQWVNEEQRLWIH